MDKNLVAKELVKIAKSLMSEKAKKDPKIQKEYDDLKRLDLKSLKGIYERSHRISDTSEYNKRDIITDILRGRHGDKVMDEFYK